MDKMRLMQSFVAVVDTGSFVAASSRLGTSRSLLSKHIRQLEISLGVQVLNRDTHSIGLTEVGAEYYRLCVRIMEDLQKGEAAVADLHSSPSGALRLMAPVAFGSLYLPRLILEFADMFPEISVRLSLWGQPLQSSEIVEQSFDLILRTALHGESSMIVRKLAGFRNVFCATPAYLQAHGEPKSFRDLDKHPCFCHERDREVSWRYRRRKGATTLRSAGSLLPQTNSFEVLRQWTLDDRGIGYLAEYVVDRDLRDGRLSEVLCDYATGERGLYALYPGARYLPMKTRLFLDFLVERFSTPAWVSSRSQILQL